MQPVLTNPLNRDTHLRFPSPVSNKGSSPQHMYNQWLLLTPTQTTGPGHVSASMMKEIIRLHVCKCIQCSMIISSFSSIHKTACTTQILNLEQKHCSNYCGHMHIYLSMHQRTQKLIMVFRIENNSSAILDSSHSLTPYPLYFSLLICNRLSSPAITLPLT